MQLLSSKQGNCVNYTCIIGIPVPIVAISAGVAYDQYGHNDLLVFCISCLKILYCVIWYSCWIDTETNVFWGVAASVATIFVVR